MARALLLRRSFWQSRSGGAAALVAGLIIGLIVAFTLERVTAGGRVLHGLTMDGLALGGLDARSLETTLTRRARRLEATPVVIQLASQELELPAGSLGLTLDVPSHVARALDAGRSGPGIVQLGAWLCRLIGPEDLGQDVSLDRARLDAVVDEWERERLEGSAFPGTIDFESAPRAIYPRAGRSVDRDALGEALARAVRSPPARVTVPLRLVQPTLSRSAVDAALERAIRLVGKPIVLEVPAPPDTQPDGKDGADGAAEDDRPSEIVLSTAELRSAARARLTGTPPALRVGFDPGRIHELLERPRERIEIAPRDAGFEVSPSGEVTVTPSATGSRIDEATLLTRLDAVAEGGPRTFALPMLPEVPPALDTQRAQSLGITGLVAKFSTYHNCCQPRVDNIHRMADLIDGVVVLPGETFSVNQHIGPRSARNGFVMAPTIVLGDMENTVGGGVSQFATTLFNAVLDGGYEIIQRQPHSYYFPRYPVGHEATLSYPSPDLAFRNDSKAGLLIKTQYGKKHIRVLLYGDNGGRKVTRKVGPRIDPVDPPVELVPNPELPPDAAKLVHRGEAGWSVVVSRTIRFPDGATTSQRRKVVYKPRPRVVEVHPCNIPKGQPGHTGEECPEPPASDAGVQDTVPSGMVLLDEP